MLAGRPLGADDGPVVRPTRWAMALVVMAVALVDCGGDGGTTRSTTTESRVGTAAAPTTTLPTATSADTSTVTSAIVVPTPPVDCSGARIVRPDSEESVPAGPLVVEWEPTDCMMDIATYQSGALVEKRTGVRSGFALEIPPPVAPAATLRTEIKIWAPGAPLPADSVWVVVRP